MNQGLGNLPLCMETRMLAAAGTGVSTYARALHMAQAALSARALTLSGGHASAPGSPQSPFDRLTRGVRALMPFPAHAHSAPAGFARQDLFRLAHAYFTLHGRLLPVRVPGPPGIMHWTYPLPLHLSGWNNLYTVHDLIPLTDPDLTPIDGARHRRLLRRIAQSASAIITVSQAAAHTIEAELDGAIKVVNCSQPVTIDRPQSLDLGLPGDLVRGRYFLVCGSIEPRKNIARILAAYHASGSSLKMVVCGPDGWGAETVAARIRDTPGVIRLPYQTREAMLALLEHARAVLMPSLAEGFGLPVAEAMALGTPVVTTSTGALAETAGNAALLVDPHDVEAMTRAIRRIEHDNPLWHALSAAGRTRAQAFAPGHFAERIGQVYEEIRSHHRARNSRSPRVRDDTPLIGQPGQGPRR